MHSFCRKLLKATLEEVRKHLTPEQIKKAWAHKHCMGKYEFHGPDGFFIGSVSGADCIWSAKAEGWQKWLEQIEEKAEV